MKRTILVLSTFAGLALLPDAAAAQSDILLQPSLRLPAGDRFRVDSAGGVRGPRQAGHRHHPAVRQRRRLMWYPFKGAFRAGGIGSGGTMWDDANIGFYTWAGGFNTIATGLYAFAMGDGSMATNTGSVAFGNDVVSSGQYATALGERTRAASRGTLASGANCSPVATCTSAHAGTSFRVAPNSNGSSAAIGQYVTADADWAIALGFRASVAGHVGSFVFGGSLAGASAATDSIRATADGQVTFRISGRVPHLHQHVRHGGRTGERRRQQLERDLRPQPQGELPGDRRRGRAVPHPLAAGDDVAVPRRGGPHGAPHRPHGAGLARARSASARTRPPST